MNKIVLLVAVLCANVALADIQLDLELTVRDQKDSGQIVLKDGDQVRIELSENIQFLVGIDPQEDGTINTNLTVLQKAAEGQEAPEPMLFTVTTLWRQPATFNFEDVQVSLAVIATEVDAQEQVVENNERA